MIDTQGEMGNFYVEAVRESVSGTEFLGYGAWHEACVPQVLERGAGNT